MIDISITSKHEVGASAFSRLGEIAAALNAWTHGQGKLAENYSFVISSDDGRDSVSLSFVAKAGNILAGKVSFQLLDVGMQPCGGTYAEAQALPRNNKLTETFDRLLEGVTAAF